jgi:N-acetylglucosaminyldiphosphoundecaprenol N-acetyl-beta-D-mannosaminyltransferase
MPRASRHYRGDGIEPCVPSPRDAAGVAIGSVRIDRATQAEALDACRFAHAAGTTMAVFTPNVDHVVQAETDPALRAAYSRAELVVADGAPLVWLTRWMKRPVPQRITGVDLFNELCAECAHDGRRIFLLGGRPESTASAATRLRATHPGINVVGTYSGTVDPTGADSELVATLNAAAPDVVGVFLGCPKQEVWVDRNRAVLPAAVYLCLGGTVDFVSGAAKRAPLIMRRAGLEWVYRLLLEPRRLWRRYLVQDIAFMRIAYRTLRHGTQDRCSVRTGQTCDTAGQGDATKSTDLYGECAS